MRFLFTLLIGAFRDVLRPRILSVLILPFLSSFILWASITWFIWDWILGLGFQFYNFTVVQKFIDLLSPYFVVTQDPITAVTTAAFIFIVILPAALITAMLVTSIVLVPILVSELRKTDFPTMLKKSNSIFTGTGISLAYSAEYLASWIGTLPLWVFIPGGAVIIPYFLLAWFNSRLFTWEVMVEIAAPQETKVFMRENSGMLFSLGLLTALLYYIPILNLIAPVVSSAAFARFCLSRYKQSESTEGTHSH